MLSNVHNNARHTDASILSKFLLCMCECESSTALLAGRERDLSWIAFKQPHLFYFRPNNHYLSSFILITRCILYRFIYLKSVYGECITILKTRQLSLRNKTQIHNEDFSTGKYIYLFILSIHFGTHGCCSYKPVSLREKRAKASGGKIIFLNKIMKCIFCCYHL